MIPPRIKKIEILENFKIKINYETNENKIYDFRKILNNNFYKKLNNPEYFKKAKSAKTTIEWPDGEDIDPNELYDNSVLIEE